MLQQTLQEMHQGPEPEGNAVSCRQVGMGWEHPSA